MNDNRRPTLATTLWPQQAASRTARFAALAIGGALALAISAKAQVPFYPVPMTLQTLVVLIIGAAFGARLALATVALYLIEGLLGLQVFAGLGAGPAYMAGPTGGFLAGFLIAAGLVGWLAERGWNANRVVMAFLAMLIGNALCLVLGGAWLAVMIGTGPAITAGVTPFILGGVLKSVLGAASLKALDLGTAKPAA